MTPETKRGLMAAAAGFVAMSVVLFVGKRLIGGPGAGNPPAGTGSPTDAGTGPGGKHGTSGGSGPTGNTGPAGKGPVTVPSPEGVVFPDADGRGWRLAGHAGEVAAVAFAGNGSLFATTGRDGTVRLWKPSPAGPIPAGTLHGHEKFVRAVALSADGATCLSGGSDEIIIHWRTADLSRTGITAKAPGSPNIQSLAVAPDDKHAVAGYQDASARIIDCKARTALTELRGHEGKVLAAAWNKDGTAFATGCEGGVVQVWSHDGGTRRKFDPIGQAVRSVAFSPDGTRLLVAVGATARLLGIADGQPLGVISDGGGPAAWTSDGRLIAVTATGNIVRLHKGTDLHALPGGSYTAEGPPLACAFSPDGKLLLVGTATGAVHVWRVPA